MKLIDAILQAILQGLTEFLPVSSSGHLALYQHFTGNSGEGALFFSAILHLGTLVAVFIAFRDTIWDLMKEFVVLVKDIFSGKFSYKNMNPERRMIVMMVISCMCLLPFAPFLGWFEGISEDSTIFAEGLCFLYTSALLYFSDRCTKGKKTPKNLNAKDAATVGFFQGVALLPGVSRSGSTICSGLFCGMTRDTAVRYSFILGIPVILLGCLTEVKDAIKTHASIEWINCIVGFAVAAVVGVCAIKMVSWLVKSNKFRVFAYYTFILGIVVIIISIIEKFIDHPITF